MGCIVVWQFSLYMVFGVLSSIGIMGWQCPFSVDAYEMVREFTSSSLLSNSSNNEPPHLKLAITSANGNNEDDSLEEQLKDDQVALKRMVTILTLVGVIGAMAIMAIIMIFTRMRQRKQKTNSKISNTPLDDEDDESITSADQQHTPETGCQQRRTNSTSSNDINNRDSFNNTTNGDQFVDTNMNNISIDPLISPPDTDKSSGQQRRLSATDGTLEFLPSAPPPPPPPATFSTSSTFNETVYRHRRMLSIPILQHSAPTPSAPSAKELNQQQQQQQQEEEEGPANPVDLHLGQYCHSEPTTSPSTRSPAIETTPDLPPPAYTLNASPLYDRTNQSSSNNMVSTSTTTSPLTSWRRHSQI